MKRKKQQRTLCIMGQQVNKLSKFKLRNENVAKASKKKRKFNLLDPKLSDLVMNSLNFN